MDEKLYLIDLDCYARAEEKEKKKVKESHCFDFGLLPTKGLQNEFRSFIENRSRQCALATMIQERVLYQRFCRMVKDKHIRAESLQELEWEQWLLKIRSWLLEHGQKLTMQGINVYKGIGVQFTDEPTGNLDSVTSMEVVGLLKSCAARFHQTTLIVTHQEEVAQMADRVIRMSDGKIYIRDCNDC